MMGLEPATYGLQNRCSTIELHRRLNISYCGHSKLSSTKFFAESGKSELQKSEK